MNLFDPFVSVVVPVLNREDTARACLESLLNLNYPEFEVIVVDGGSRDETREIIAEYPVKLLIDLRKGAYVARNTAVSCCFRCLCGFFRSGKMGFRGTCDRIGALLATCLQGSTPNILTWSSGCMLLW